LEITSKFSLSYKEKISLNDSFPAAGIFTKQAVLNLSVNVLTGG
jgi:hypothetical protein